MDIIQLQSLQVGASVAGLVFISEHGKHDGKSRAPLYGQLRLQASKVRFKVWNSNSPDIVALFNQHDCGGRVASIAGDVSEYKGNTEITITSISFLTEEQQKAYLPLFVRTADVESLAQELWGLLHTEMNENHKNFALEFFQAEENKIWVAFIRTWGGKVMHDAQIGGLLNHVIKMMRIAKTLASNDPRLQELYSFLQLNILFHDIGKIYEMGEMGQYTNVGFITHRSLGVEMFAERKQMCLKHLTNHEYYVMLSVMQGHHGDFGDKPFSLLAYWIHLIDMLESKMTMFLDKIEGGELQEKDGNTVVQVPFSTDKLVL